MIIPRSSIPAIPAARWRISQTASAPLILEALACETADEHQQIAARWREVSEETAALAADTARRRGLFRSRAPLAQEIHRYLQVITRVRDDQDEPVNDYFIEFFSPDARSDASLLRFQNDVLDHVHVNKLEPVGALLLH